MLRSVVLELKELSTKSFDLASSTPPDVRHFDVWIDAEIEALQEARTFGIEVFSFRVCTPSSLQTQIVQPKAVWGRGILILDTWSSEIVVRHVRILCQTIQEPTWNRARAALAQYMLPEHEPNL